MNLSRLAGFPVTGRFPRAGTHLGVRGNRPPCGVCAKVGAAGQPETRQSDHEAPEFPIGTPLCGASRQVAQRHGNDDALGSALVPSATPAAGQEFHGTVDAIAKISKRDKARFEPLPDMVTVLQQISGWIGVCDRVHPHSGMRFLVDVQAHHAKPNRLFRRNGGYSTGGETC